jgi:hypothetical protein
MVLKNTFVKVSQNYTFVKVSQNIGLNFTPRVLRHFSEKCLHKIEILFRK